jgi:hypothetical protein
MGFTSMAWLLGSVYTLLLIVSIIFLTGSIRKRQTLRLFIFSACAAFCVYKIIALVLIDRKFTKMEEQLAGKNFRNIPEGDTTIIEGIISSPSDELNNADNGTDTTNKKILMQTGDIDFSTVPFLMITLNNSEYNQLEPYMHFYHRETDTVSYHLRIRAVKLNKDHNEWRFIKLIDVNEIKKLPQY